MRKSLYLGLDPTRCVVEGELIHYPIIGVVPKKKEELSESLAKLMDCTHVICTSRSTVSILLSHAPECVEKKIIAVGNATAELLRTQNVQQIFIANPSQAEGVVSLLLSLHRDEYSYFYPHSARARPVIKNYLMQENISHHSCVLYDTVFQDRESLPDLTEIDEIIFTSPSTIDAFCEVFGSLPQEKKLRAIGPVTERHLNKLLGKKLPMAYVGRLMDKFLLNFEE